MRSRLRLLPGSRELPPPPGDDRVVPHGRARDLVAGGGSQRGRRPCVAAVLRRGAHHSYEGQRGDDSMNTHHESWSELASREADRIVVSLLWSRAGNRVKVVAADTRTERQFEFAVAPARALDAFAIRSSTPAPRSRSARRCTRRRSPLDRLLERTSERRRALRRPRNRVQRGRSPIPASRAICTTPARRKATARHIQVTHTHSKEK